LSFGTFNFTSTTGGTLDIAGANTFANLSIAGKISSTVLNLSFNSNQTITGSLTISAGTNATMRNFLQSNIIGTTRTLTCGAFSGTDVDFRDITIAGAAAPVSGTRLGDAKGNSGITFDAGVNKYWSLAAGGNWSATGWATTSGGSPAANNFPLAQDTAIFEAIGLNPSAVITINASYNIGTIDMSARTTDTMTLDTGTTAPTIYGNWINGTGTTLTGTGALTFAGRGSQTITSAGVTFPQGFVINTLSGSVILTDSLLQTGSLTITAGTFNALNYNYTTSSVFTSGTIIRSIAVGSGLWIVGPSSSGTVWSTSASTNFTVTGTGTIKLPSSSTKTFSGGNIPYTNITLDQGGAGTLTISGNNIFKDITNTSGVATTINFAATSTTLSQFTAAGTAGNLLTISGTSAASPATLIYTGGGNVNVGYLTINNVRGYPL
jgi:hypothetical protein